MGGTYAVGMRAQVWTFLRDEREARLASKKDLSVLLKGLISEAHNRGLYSYYTDLATGKPQPGYADHSASQFGVLGMWACEQVGQEVPTLYWQQVDAKWKADQQPDGGWYYDPARFHTVTPTMTNAGVATLFITQDYLQHYTDWGVCKGGVRNQHIEKGLTWVDAHIKDVLAGNGMSTRMQNYFYALYGVERIGVASGRKYFGTVDWYTTGADLLARMQNADGSWGTENSLSNPKGISDTVFAMLFLVRGRAPVMMNKLEYTNEPPAEPSPKVKPQEDPWNERPRDVANFTHWSGKQLEQYLNWQVVNLRVAADELHDAPVLYIAGSEALNFRPESLQKLRDFVEQGGLILGNADGGSAEFATSFIKLAHDVWPKYAFRELPANHPIYTEEQYRAAKWKTRPRVLGISNGVRELMILIPDADLGRAWQTRSDKTKQESYELAQNIFLYAVDKKNLRWRGETYIIPVDNKAVTEHSLKVARLLIGDNADPEPGGWRRLHNLLHNSYKTEVLVQPVKLGEGKLSGSRLAHLTGTTRFTLNAAQVNELKDFFAAGGTLFIDAAGGSSEFANSAEAALSVLSRGQQSKPSSAASGAELGVILPPEDALYDRPRIDSFGYRSFVRGRLSGQLNAPRVRAIRVDGRNAIYYSREDISGGLVGEPVDGIVGYDPETATAILRNLILHLAGGPSVATTETERPLQKLQPPGANMPPQKPKKKPAGKPTPKSK